MELYIYSSNTQVIKILRLSFPLKLLKYLNKVCVCVCVCVCAAKNITKSYFTVKAVHVKIFVHGNHSNSFICTLKIKYHSQLNYNVNKLLTISIKSHTPSVWKMDMTNKSVWREMLTLMS